jgi:hypothetical protein
VQVSKVFWKCAPYLLKSAESLNPRNPGSDIIFFGPSETLSEPRLHGSGDLSDWRLKKSPLSGLFPSGFNQMVIVGLWFSWFFWFPWLKKSLQAQESWEPPFRQCFIRTIISWATAGRPYEGKGNFEGRGGETRPCKILYVLSAKLKHSRGAQAPGSKTRATRFLLLPFPVFST